MAEKIKKFSKKIIALLIMFSLVLSFFTVISKTNAAAMTNVKMTITDSRPSQASTTYTVNFTGSATTIQCFKILFRNAASGGSAPAGLLTTGAAEGTWTGLTAASWTTDFTTDDQITSTWAASTENTSGGVSLGFTTITNPSATATFFAQITTYSDSACTASVDTGVAAAAIIPTITVTATVNESLTATINGRTTAQCFSDFGVTTDQNSTSTSIPFGNINVNTFYNICQQLVVGTNATDGYNVTVQEDDQLRIGVTANYIVGANDDGNCDGTCTDSTSAAWISTADAAGGFGYCVDDVTGDAAATAPTSWAAANQCGGASPQYKTIADAGNSEAAQNIMSSAAPVSDTTDIMFRILAPATQTAGVYTNKVIYIATPQYN